VHLSFQNGVIARAVQPAESKAHPGTRRWPYDQPSADRSATGRWVGTEPFLNPKNNMEEMATARIAPKRSISLELGRFAA
jgi:hypothetical protein